MSRSSSPFWKLVEGEHNKARAFCSRLTGNQDEGDDLYQDSVLRAHRGFDELKDVNSFRPWFYQIINNAYKSRFRNPWWKRVLSGSVDLENYERGSDPTSTYEARRRLDFAFSSLSADDRIIVTLAELEGWRVSELAELTSKSEGFIKMRLSRARKKMRKRLVSLHRRSTPQLSQEGTENICCVTKPEKN